MKLTTTVLTAALVTLGLAACGSGDKGDKTPSGGAAPATAAIVIRDYKFGPPDVTVKAGARVTWTNQDTSPHTATAAGKFDTGTLKKGESKSVVVGTPGTYSYVCQFHPYMKAKLTVIG
jgi:plastocyanin